MIDTYRRYTAQTACYASLSAVLFFSQHLPTYSQYFNLHCMGHAIAAEVDFHSQEPIIMSCGSDKQIFLGEIEQS
jgi:hypothetical protein